MNSQLQHILNTSSNLLGICMVLVTGIHLSHTENASYVDELTLVAAFLFLGSCCFSYLSMRDEKDTVILEHIADYFFLGGIGLLFVAMLLLTFNYI